MSKGKSLLLGILVGGTVSAAATLLATPESGRNLRSRAQNIEWKELIEKFKDDGLKIKEQFTETSKEGAVLIKKLTREMKSSVEDWKRTVEPHQESIHKYLEEIESNLRDLEDKVKV